jgi:hypothetical protein
LKTVYAKNTSPVYVNGHIVIAGQHWPADDPVVRAQPELFTDDARYGLTASVPVPPEPVVEQATAAPGEKRATRRPSQ